MYAENETYPSKYPSNLDYFADASLAMPSYINPPKTK